MRNHRCETILCETIGAVVHDAFDIILFAKVRNHLGRVHVEVVNHIGNNVLPTNTNVCVTHVRTLHVKKAQRVQKFVHNS